MKFLKLTSLLLFLSMCTFKYAAGQVSLPFAIEQSRKVHGIPMKHSGSGIKGPSSNSSVYAPEDWIQMGPVTSAPFHQMHDFSHPTDSTIWVAGLDFGSFFGISPSPSKELGRSLDRGMTWEAIQVDFEDSSLVLTADSVLSPYVVEAVNDSLIWAGLISLPQQSYGALAKSQDGGASWERVDIPLVDSQEIPVVMYFFHPDSGVIFTQTFSPVQPNLVQIYLTEDGGDSFTLVSPVEDSVEAQSVFLVESLLEVVGDTLWYGTKNGQILKSLDQGRSWDILETGYGIGNSIRSLAFQDALNGLAVVDLSPFGFFVPSHLIRTRDGGDTWERIPAPNIIENVFYIEGSGGVFVASMGGFGRPGLLLSKDFGDTWTYEIPLPFSVAFSFRSPTEGYFSTTNMEGGVFSYEGEPLVFDSDQAEDLQFMGNAIPSLPDSYEVFDIHVVSDSVIWANAFDVTYVNQSANPDHVPIVLRTVNGGGTWDILEIEEAIGRVSFDIYAFDGSTAWVTTENNDRPSGRGVFVTTDGGTSWVEKFNDVSAGAWLHWFEPAEGILLNRNSMAKTYDGGENWDILPDSLIPAFDSSEFTLLFSGENSKAIYNDNLWFGTSLGRIFRSKNRGNSWEAYQVVPDSNGIVASLAFKDSLNGLAAVPRNSNSAFKFPGTIYSTSDGGESWTQLPPFIRPIHTLEYIPGTDNGYLAATFEDQFLGYTLDGGNSWIFVPDVLRYGAIDFSTPQLGWVANTTGENSLFPPLMKYVGDAFPGNTSVSSKNFVHDVEVTIYPNPSSGVIHIESNQSFTKIGLVDVMGRHITLQTGSRLTQWQGSLEGLETGNYWLSLEMEGSTFYHLVEIK